jgi:hypothetical protein
MLVCVSPCLPSRPDDGNMASIGSRSYGGTSSIGTQHPFPTIHLVRASALISLSERTRTGRPLRLTRNRTVVRRRRSADNLAYAGWNRQTFTTMEATRVLGRLGFCLSAGGAAHGWPPGMGSRRQDGP